MKYEAIFIEALYEVLASTGWKKDGLKVLENLPESISNITLDKDIGLIEFQDEEGVVTYEITIRKTHAGRKEMKNEDNLISRVDSYWRKR